MSDLSGAIRAGAAYVELLLNDKGFSGGLDKAAARLQDWGTNIAAIGAGMFAAGAAVIAPMLAAAQAFAESGDKLTKASDRTGASVESLGALSYAAEQSGTSLETLQKAIIKQQQALSSAKDGSKDATKAFADIGLSATKLIKLSPDEQFIQIAEAISKIKNPAERSDRAIGILGKGAVELMPMMLAGAAGIQELTDKAKKLNLVMSKEDTDAATKLGDTIDDLWKTLDGVANAIGSALAPLLTELAEKATHLVVSTIAWVRENKELVVTIFQVAAGVAAAGIALIAIGGTIVGLGAVLGGAAAMIAAVAAGIGAVGSAIAFILSPLGLLVAGIGAFAVAMTGVNSWQEVLDGFGQGFEKLKDIALTAFGAIGKALAAGDLALAGKVLWATLKLYWQEGITFLNTKWQEWKGIFLNTWNNAVSSLATIFTNAWAGLKSAWVETVNFMSSAWNAVWNSIQDAHQKSTFTIAGAIVDAREAAGNLSAEDAKIQREALKSDEDYRNRVKTKERITIADTSEADRKKQLAQIEADRIGSVGIIESDRTRAEKKNLEAQNDAVKASRDELKAATEEWQAMIGKGNEAGSLTNFQYTDPVKKLSEVAGNAITKSTSAGTFSGAIASQLGSGSGIMSKVEANTEKAAKILEKIEKKPVPDSGGKETKFVYS